MNNKRSYNDRNKHTNSNENEHIPRYIKTKPWYYNDSKSEDYLIHHRQKHGKDNNSIDIDHNDEPKIGLGIEDRFISMKRSYKKNKSNICENCGSEGHSRRDCLEKPRKLQSRIEGENIEVKVRDDDNLDWDAKNDRWFGYAGKEYDETLQSWREKRDRNMILDNQDKESTWDIDEEVELFKLGLQRDSAGKLREERNGKAGASVTSVRLREDKAAYLKDIHSDEINYDPKSRLYKSQELGTVDEKSKMFRRKLVGEGLELEKLHKFSRDYAKSVGIRDEREDKKKIEHVLIANPTKYEQLMKQQKSIEQEKANKNKVDISTLQAQKLHGTKQSEEDKKQIMDLYE
ncbi:hypothetical protein KAFR_0A02480 [Kazachstania africana CBS 2517]|uniref:Pre-mRNA-splicing factor SLU7 n=1 Tax=Kazachstania africana (strain ATCC 22294 / BCRC 22015 / CBS 2517 / CECT 1963 / NBRC 1671 / NRRL Y-8276) TaxID=1071382 RepID=H2AMT4_KAZAF|nr:hypothetical protein KAFR_0A02480 [Kazachstania africana CBS 2517]CCF55684.1 hypothetical protein KAFR_0A02480 [Kazachstania africana CBS 2517]